MAQRLGEMLVDKGVITHAQLERALAKQGQGRKQPLGALLLTTPAMTCDQLMNIISDLRVEKLFGEILVDRKLVTPEQVVRALAKQQTSKEPLGAILVNAGALTYDQLLGVLSELSDGRQGDA